MKIIKEEEAGVEEDGREDVEELIVFIKKDKHSVE